MSVELTIETVEETIVLELQDHVPPVITIDHIPYLRDELDSKVDKEAGLGLSELSFTTADKSSLDQSELDRHTHSNKAVIDDLSDDGGVLQYKSLPISDQAALDAKVDKVPGKSLVDDDEIAKLLTVQADATKNSTDAELRDRATHTGEQAISTVTDLQGALDSKADKETGKSLVSDLEIAKLANVQENATENRPDELNADKVHEHVIADVTELAAKLELINQWLQVPTDKKYFDFVGNRYSENGAPAPLSSLGSTFTRLSAATQWKDGVLTDVAANVMRLDKAKGLLIEKSITELIPNNSSLTSTNTAWTATQKTDAQIGSVFEFVSDGSAAIIRTSVPEYPAGNVAPNNGYYYRSVLAKKTDVDSYFIFGASSGAVSLILNLRDGSVGTVGERVAQHKVTLIGHYYLIESLSTETGAVQRQFYLYASNNRGTASTLAAPTSGHSVTVAFPSFRDTADFPQSIIKTTGVRSTRAKENLVIPFATGQTVTADKDEGVTMTIVDNNAVFEGQGYIRSIRIN